MTNIAQIGRVLVVHGPNLNLLGTREPHIYGSTTLQQLEQRCRDQGAALGLSVDCFQSNLEGALIDRIHQAIGQCEGLVINAGAYTHTSIALHDAMKNLSCPIIEVHISNVYAREAFRHHSYISPIAKAVMCGFGIDGYGYALQHLAALLNDKR